MSKNYRDEQDREKEKKIKEFFSDDNDSSPLPFYVKDFYGVMKSTGKKISTLFTYLNVINLFFDYLSSNDMSPIKGTKKKDISPELLDNLKVIDVNRFFTESGISPTTRNKYHSSINALFDYLYRNDLITHNVMGKVDRATVKKYEHKVIRLTDAQSVGFLDAVRTGEGLTKKQSKDFQENSLRNTAICLTLLRTGLRVSELVSLDLGDIDMEASSFTVVRKGNKTDTVYFDDETKSALEEYIETLPLPHLSANPLFISNWGKTKGKRITVRQVEHLVKKYTAVGAKGTGTGVSPHKLRATFATAMLNETGNITLVQSQLAHENIQTTSIYIDSSSQDKKNARNILMERDEKARKLENPLEDVGAEIYKK